MSLTARPPILPTAPPTVPAAAKLTPASALDVYTGDPNFMTSLARGLIVIQAFTQQSPQMTISQLSIKTGLSRAAVRRCLYTLTKLGFAGAEDGSRYSLRPRMLTLSHTYTTSNTLAAAAQPILERMSAALQESFSVATLDGEDIVYIARTQVNRVMAVDLHIGSRLPAYCTSMGRILLAYLPAEQLICDQEYEVGLRSIAVPVYSSSGRVVATLNLSGNAPRISVLEMQSRFLAPLRNAASELSAFLN
jgi:IclR family pca regulon transcriptional regulator